MNDIPNILTINQMYKGARIYNLKIVRPLHNCNGKWQWQDIQIVFTSTNMELLKELSSTISVYTNWEFLPGISNISLVSSEHIRLLKLPRIILNQNTIIKRSKLCPIQTS